jgi:phosphate-selective porin OprO/OprP
MSYMMEFDFAQAQARFVDVWGQLNETPVGKLRIGRFRQPFGMSELTSVRELPLMERPSAFASGPFRQTGMMLFDQFSEERGTWAVSGFRTLSDNFGNVYGDDGGFGAAGRVTWAWHGQNQSRLMHVGFAASRLDPARDQWLLASQDEIFVGQQPNLGPGGLSVFPLVAVPPFVNSGLIQTDSIDFCNFEAAASIGRGLIQAEHRWARVDLASGSDRTATASYMTLRWMLSGEQIPYNSAGGVFGRIKPDCPLDFQKGHWGAWEAVGQVSTINLNPLFGHPDVPGPTRRLLSSTVGVNWYWNLNTKCQVEWVTGTLNDPALGNSVSTTVAGRFQDDF